MYFDKIKNLNGYNIKAALPRDTVSDHYDIKKTGSDRCSRSSKIICVISTHINASLIVKESNSHGYIGDYGKPEGAVKDVLSGTCDISLLGYFVADYWKQQTHPFTSGALKIVTLKNSLLHGHDIMFTFTLKVWCVLIIGCITSTIILKHVLILPTSMIALEFFRLLTGAGNLHQPRSSKARLILLMVTVYSIVLGSSFQSWLSATSTVGYHSPPIDTVDDLIQSKLEVYGLPSFKEFTLRQNISNRYYSINDMNECASDRLLKGNRVACIIYKTLNEYFKKTDPVHLSEHNLVENAIVYNFAEDFPLSSKFNGIILKLKEGGFIQLFYNSYEYQSRRQTDGVTSAIGLDAQDLAINFQFISTSLSFAIIVFFFEIFIYFINTVPNFMV